MGNASRALIERSTWMNYIDDYELPLFVPSFSSKGNVLLPALNNTYISDNYDLLKKLDMRVFETYLVSAYDIYYGYMPKDPEELPETRFLFVDSGGYEINDSFEINEKNKFNYHVNPWDKEKMIDVYDRIASSIKFQNSTLILSGFDNTNITISEQIANIHSMQERYPTAIVNYLLRITDNMNAVISGICNTQFLEEIKVIGLTEKELGYTVQDKVRNLIAIKEALNNEGWTGRIHIFGGLDPVLTKLYFFSGADIFDGLSWQRMRYCDLSTLFHPSHYQISLSEEENKFRMMAANISELRQTKDELSLCATDRDDLRKKLLTILDNTGLSISAILKKLEE